MFRHYFQTGDEDEGAGSSGEEEAEQQPHLPPPEEVWGQVCTLRRSCLRLQHPRHCRHDAAASAAEAV